MPLGNQGDHCTSIAGAARSASRCYMAGRTWRGGRRLRGGGDGEKDPETVAAVVGEGRRGPEGAWVLPSLCRCAAYAAE